MKHNIINQYVTLVHFLGEALGQDYEILLYNIENNNNSLVASSSKDTSDSSIGKKLPKELLKLLKSDTFSEKGYCTNLPGKRVNISVNRNSYMIIKDSSDHPIGLLCILFDDTRFTKLHDYLLSVAHPLDFVKNHSFHTIHHLELYETDEKLIDADNADANLQNLMDNTFRDAIMKANVPTERLNQEERLIVIKYLKEYGFFRLKGAVPYAAKHLECSKASIYRYLGDLK